MRRTVNYRIAKSWSAAAKISIAYCLVALVWVAGLERLFPFLTRAFGTFPHPLALKYGTLILVSATIVFVLVDRQLSKEKKRHLRIAEYNNTLASLIKHPDFIKGDFDAMLHSLTRILSDVLGVERVSVWKLNKTKTELFIEALDLWESDKKGHSSGTILHSQDFPRYFETLLTDRTLTFNDVYSDHRVTEFAAEYFPANNIASMLDAPFHFSGEIAGVVCLEHTGEARIWTIEEEAFIMSAADILSIVFGFSQRQELELTLRRSEKMDALGKLTGGIAHDYNNLLGIIVGYSELLEACLADQPDLEEYARGITRAGERGTKLTQKLLSFSRNKSANSEAVDLNTILQDGEHMLATTLTARIDLQLKLCDDVWPIWVDSADLEDAIVNMCINAMHAIKGTGDLALETSNSRLGPLEAETLNLDPRDYVRLDIRDDGCGIERALVTKIFEPFFSTKKDKGTGLGLSQVYGFVERSQGAIKVESTPGLGTCISLYFPRHEASSAAQGLQVPDSLAGGAVYGEGTILVVDDEQDLLEVTATTLRQKGYRVLSANSGKKALEVLKANVVDVLLSDVIMPEMSGYQLSSIVKSKYPDVQIQLMSGYVDVQNTDELDAELHKNTLRKPVKSVVLLGTIQSLLLDSRSLGRVG